MDTRRKVELQIRAVVVVYRRELRRLEPQNLAILRDHGRALLDSVEPEASRYPELMAALANVREEMDRDDRLAANRLEQPIDRLDELFNSERLR